MTKKVFSMWSLFPIAWELTESVRSSLPGIQKAIKTAESCFKNFMKYKKEGKRFKVALQDIRKFKFVTDLRFGGFSQLTSSEYE